MSVITEQNKYLREQSKLLVKIVPFLDPFKCFAFHGGTVINLFCNDSFKRYSVDLDGVFIPDKTIDISSKSEVFNSINSNLTLLKKQLLTHKKELNIIDIKQYRNRTALIIYAKNPFDTTNDVKVKIEANKTYVGSIDYLVKRELKKFFRKDFKTNCSILSVSDNQLYGSKIGALFGRNELKDSYDLFHFLSEGKNLVQYKSGIIYNLLSNTADVITILNIDYNEKPKNIEDQIEKLGQQYSLGKHVFTRKRIKEIVLESLNEQDLHYILASSMGILDKSDYPFKNMRGVMIQNKVNKEYRENHPSNYEARLQEFINMFPFEKQKRMIKKELKSLEKIGFDSSTGLNL